MSSRTPQKLPGLNRVARVLYEPQLFLRICLYRNNIALCLCPALPGSPSGSSKNVKQFHKTCPSKATQNYANRCEMPGCPWAFSLQFYPCSESPTGTTGLQSRRPTASSGLSDANPLTAGKGMDTLGIVLHPPPTPSPKHPSLPHFRG